ncbi:hypothetical protein DH2020_008728 [Rehmannia glutinosa]|uniref:Cellulose synthase-like protein n=1 Tax=Rehmannia glutinosa TaxID=99300 RepID=A0ABR0X7P3_REHGL
MTDNFGEEDVLPLFETKTAKGRAAYKLYCLIVLLGIVWIWVYRLVHIPGAGERGRYAWMAMFFAEVLFGVYWIITQACRWHVVYRYPFKDRLSTRYKDKLPGVDIFVCTADPTLEPPLLVINTVLSVMSYNYPSHKLGVFLSDDGCSELTFYALLEASKFSKYWIPFCKKYNVEPRAPEIYFAQNTDLNESNFARMDLYQDMKRRIDSAGAKGCIPEEIKDEHKGFSEWNSRITKQDHQSIVQDNRFRCVQYPQRYSNVTKNDVYANVSNATIQIELAGLDGFGGTLYIGTGCFHRRESVSGNYEKGTLWGKEMGLVYGCSVEDIVTGLTIQCRGWKPVYYNPTKIAFQGVGSTTLDVALIQFKRWSEGMFQIFLSKYCPLIYGHGKVKVGAQMGYCIYLLWAPVSLPTLFYVVIPALYLLHDVPLFPQVSSLWFVPFAYVFVARTAYSLVEDLMCGDTIYKQLGLSETSFAVTDKVVDDEVQKELGIWDHESLFFWPRGIGFVYGPNNYFWDDSYGEFASL